MFLPLFLVLSLSLPSSAFVPPSPPRRSLQQLTSSSLRNSNLNTASQKLRYDKGSSVVLFSYPGNAEKSIEEHLQGIGVGIDLGTTNSAVAMMIACENKVGYVISCDFSIVLRWWKCRGFLSFASSPVATGDGSYMIVFLVLQLNIRMMNRYPSNKTVMLTISLRSSPKYKSNAGND